MKNRPFTVFFLAIAIPVLVATYFIVGLIDDVKEQQARAEIETIDRQVGQCETANSSRRTIQSLLNEFNNAEGVGAVDFDSVDGWDELAPETKVFLVNLGLVLASQDGTVLDTVSANYRKTNPIQDCSLVEKELREKLDG